MRSKSWLIILVIGIVGFCALGFITKYAMESNPALARMGKLKQALAEDLSSRGVKDVSVRALPKHRGIEVRVEAPRAKQADPAALAGEIAENVVRKYGGPAPRVMKLALVEPPRLGCRPSGAYFEKEISFDEVTADLELRATMRRLEESLPPGAGFRVRSYEKGDPLKLIVEIPKPKGNSELERAASLLRTKAREHLDAGKTRSVIFSLWTAETPSEVLKEERIERPAPVNRRASAPSPGAGRKP